MSYANPPARVHKYRRQMTQAAFQLHRHNLRLIARYICNEWLSVDLPSYLTDADRITLHNEYYQPPTDATYGRCNTCRYVFKTHTSGAINARDVLTHKRLCVRKHACLKGKHNVRPTAVNITPESATLESAHQIAFSRRDSNFATLGLRYALTHSTGRHSE